MIKHDWTFNDFKKAAILGNLVFTWNVIQVQGATVGEVLEDGSTVSGIESGRCGSVFARVI